MATPDSNPLILTQNQRRSVLAHTKERFELYRAILQRRLDRAEKNVTGLKVPNSRGMRLRISGMQFHSTPQIIFQEGGRTRYTFPHETLVVDSGEGIVIPAQMPHSLRWLGGEFLILLVVFHAESFFLHLGYLEDENRPGCCGPIDRLYAGDRFTVMRYAEEMAGVSGNDAVSQRIRHGLYTAMLARILQALRPSRLAPPPPNDRLTRCNEMIEFYSCKMDFSVAGLARELGCSPDHISRRFRAHTGFRIMEAVHRRRIDQARHLLHDSDMNVAEIAWSCGFSQPSYFNRIFKTLTGTTPKAFREGSNSGRQTRKRLHKPT